MSDVTQYVRAHAACAAEKEKRAADQETGDAARTA
jgi:hypothetical protein